MIVLDASAWVDMVTGLVPPFEPADDVVVPPHFDAEAVGALRALEQRRALPADVARHLLEHHLRAGFAVEHDPADVRRAWGWRDSMSITDAWYAAMALRHAGTWITRDARAARTARRHGVQVQVPEARA